MWRTKLVMIVMIMDCYKNKLLLLISNTKILKRNILCDRSYKK